MTQDRALGSRLSPRLGVKQIVCPFKELFVNLAHHVSLALVFAGSSTFLTSTTPSLSTPSRDDHLPPDPRTGGLCLVAWPYKVRSHQDSDIGGKLACLWIYTKAVICNGQKEHGRVQRQDEELCDRSRQQVVWQGMAESRVGFVIFFDDA